jgi:hypothetical protein
MVRRDTVWDALNTPKPYGQVAPAHNAARGKTRFHL